MNNHIYFFPIKNSNSRNNPILNQTQIKQAKFPSTHSYSKQAFKAEFSNYDDRPSTKEKSDFSLYSLTTNNDLPLKPIKKIKSNYDKPQSSLFSTENTIRNEHFKNDLKEKIKFYKENYEGLSEKYYAVLRSNENFEKKIKEEKEQLKSKNEQNNNMNDSKNRMNFLENEIKTWKKKYEETEKRNFHEIADTKLLFRNSIISSESDIPEENVQNDESKALIYEIKEKIEVMILKNMELNKMLNRLLDELGFLKIESQFGREEFMNTIINKLKKERQEIEKKLMDKLDVLQKEIAENKFEIENNKINYENSYRSYEKNTKNTHYEEGIMTERLTYLETKNKKLENELENLKLLYWNLEKKMQFDSLMGSDDKFTEEHLENLVYQTKKDNFMKVEELKEKVKKLEKHKESLQKKTSKKETHIFKPNIPDKYLKK